MFVVVEEDLGPMLFILPLQKQHQQQQPQQPPPRSSPSSNCHARMHENEQQVLDLTTFHSGIQKREYFLHTQIAALKITPASSSCQSKLKVDRQSCVTIGQLYLSSQFSQLLLSKSIWFSQIPAKQMAFGLEWNPNAGMFQARLLSFASHLVRPHAQAVLVGRRESVQSGGFRLQD